MFDLFRCGSRVVRGACAGALLVVAASAIAADWDHDANIDAAVDGLIAAFHAGGMAQVERVVAGCYQEISAVADVDERLKRLEACASMDFAAFRVDRFAPPGSRSETEYFAQPQIMQRMAVLGEFVKDPGVENQILRAWSRAAAIALDRQGVPN